jgi:hypothetical protein
MSAVKNVLFSFFAISTLAACEKSASGGDGSGDPNVGKYWTAYKSENGNDHYIITFDIKPGNQVEMYTYYYTTNSASAYFRVNKSSYVKDGEQYRTTTSYETCKGISKDGEDTLLVKSEDPSDAILITQGETSLQLLNAAKYADVNKTLKSFSTFIEDPSCDKFTR